MRGDRAIRCIAFTGGKLLSGLFDGVSRSARPRGHGTRSLFSSCAISRSVRAIDVSPEDAPALSRKGSVSVGETSVVAMVNALCGTQDVFS
jgi:hypothetical protein